MDRMTEAKREYHDIPIPQELSERVALEVERAEKKRRFSLLKRRIASAAAMVIVLFVTGLNTSEVFAREMNDIPVIGTLARIFTIRSYETETEDLKISVDIPSVEMIAEDLQGLEKRSTKIFTRSVNSMQKRRKAEPKSIGRPFWIPAAPGRNGRSTRSRSRCGTR